MPGTGTGIFHVLGSSHGGGAVHVRTLTAGLARRGVAVHVAMPLDGGHVDSDDFIRQGVSVVPWHGTTVIQKVRALAALLRAQTPRLLHVHGSRAAVLTWSAARLARRSDIPLIYSVHGFVTPFHRPPRRFVQHAAERVVGRSCHTILAASQHERHALLEANIGTIDRVRVLPQGVDVAPFVQLSAVQRIAARQNLRIDEPAFVIVAVCRLDRPRDFPTLLHACAQLVRVQPRSRLLLVGDGPDRRTVEALIARLHLNDQVTLLGLQRDPAPFYAAADAFVSTSFGWEALGIATIEAQAACLPVVVTNAGGAAEAFAPGISGLLVPREDPAALANALHTLAADATLRRRMGEAGRAHAVATFAIEPMIDALIRCYDEGTRRR